jgi:hypothetical protein
VQSSISHIERLDFIATNWWITKNTRFRGISLVCLLYYMVLKCKGKLSEHWGKIIFLFVFSFLPVQAFALHDFKYIPYDANNTTANDTSYQNIYTDGVGINYWQRKTTTDYIQSSVIWTTKAYVYVIGEMPCSYAYNQFYLKRTDGSNLSYYSGNGHSPEQVSTFSMDSKTLYVCRLYTETGLSVTDFRQVGATSHLNRVYAFYPSDSGSLPQTVNSQATLISFLQSLGSTVSTSTHIISFTPNDGDVLSASSSIAFSLNAYISPEDLGTIQGVRITFHNIDQNVLFSSFSNDDIVFYNDVASTSGIFSFASSTTLTAGNYRIEAKLERSYVYGFFTNPFSSINDTQSHQFIVGTSTFLGNISQNSFTQAQTIYSSFTATTTGALANTCNPFSGFDTMNCIAFLFVPSSDQLNSTMGSLRDGVLTRVPFGYFNRMYTIWRTTATSTLPSVVLSIPTGATTYETISFNFGDMLTGGASTLGTVSSPKNGKSVRDVLEPFVKLLIAIAVFYTIITDIAGLHKHDKYS